MGVGGAVWEHGIFNSATLSTRKCAFINGVTSHPAFTACVFTLLHLYIVFIIDQMISCE